MANSSSPTGAHGPSKGHVLGSAGGIIAGITGFMYAYSFLVMRDAGHASIWLLISATASSAALVTLYSRVQATDPTIALWALLLGVIGAIGSAVHGGYDLANAIHPPGTNNPDLPNAIDPRGLLTFGVASLSLFAYAHVMYRTPGIPRGLTWLATLLGVLSLDLYIGRLTVLEPTSPIIAYPAILAGFLVNPVWYLWLGIVLWRREA
jgi:hypothetical protein